MIEDQGDYFDVALRQEEKLLVKNVLINEVKDLILALEQAEKEEKKYEELFEAAKKKRRRLSHEKIPALFSSIGMAELTIDGRTISIVDDLSVTVKNMDELYSFLSARGEDNLVKTTIFIGKPRKDQLDRVVSFLVAETGAVPEVVQTIHKKTLEKWVREITGGTPPEVVPPCVSVFSTQKTKITRNN